MAALVIAVAVSGSILGVRWLGLLEPLELSTFDWTLREVRTDGIREPRIALVRIREEDIAKYGHPLSDARLAQVLEALASYGPRTIGVDLYRDHAVPPGSRDLEGAVLANRGIVMIEKALGDERIPAPSYVAGTGQVGFSDIVSDADGRVRRGLLMVQHGDVGGPSFATRLALVYLADEGILPRWSSADGSPVLWFGENRIERFRGDFGGYRSADEGGYQVFLDQAHGRPRFLSYSLDEVLTGAVGETVLRDRVVILGSEAASVSDAHHTPFGEVTGIEYHAQLVSFLLDRALLGAGPTRALGELGEAAIVLLWGLIAAFIGASVRSRWLLPLAPLVGLAATLLGSLLALRASWWLPLVPLSLTWVGCGTTSFVFVSLREREERQRIMDLFGRFLDRKVASEVWRRRNSFLRGGRPKSQRCALTVMIADLEGFAATSELLDPDPLMEWINEYLAAMARIIGSHGGVIDDYFGDGIKANFGVPVPRRTEQEIVDDAIAAVDCALAMEAALEGLNRAWTESDLPVTRARVGIQTGPAVVGLIGSAERLKYTSVGDTVNTAARLESYSSDAGPSDRQLRILVGEQTHRCVGRRFESRPLGKIEFRGKAEPVSVYEILGRAREPAE
ncbi:MAG: adenylate/guanylate cyclase domain-containing protein [Myxococcota bacterium]|nr:adenylate/guanylate cyclase domain-containing protein [Myxococcota bacterium]